MQTDLVLDIGNTWIKGAFFEQGEISDGFRVKNFNLGTQQKINNKNIAYTIVSNVRQLKVAGLGIKCKTLIELNSSLKYPFTNQYQSPETLGMDRTAAVAGAMQLFPNTDLLIITAGTCLTYNLLTQEGHFLGGAISPGLTMRYRALQQFTGKLPLVKHQVFDGLVGKNTEESIKSGVQNGMLAEMDGIINQYKAIYPNLVVLLTGGATVFFENKLKNKIFAHPNLIFKGLYKILKINVT